MRVVKLETEDGEISLNVYDESEKDYQSPNREDLENTLDLTKIVMKNDDEK